MAIITSRKKSGKEYKHPISPKKSRQVIDPSEMYLVTQEGLEGLEDFANSEKEDFEKQIPKAIMVLEKGWNDKLSVEQRKKILKRNNLPEEHAAKSFDQLNPEMQTKLNNDYKHWKARQYGD